MNKYQRGKIYKIINNQNDECYVGSTTEKYLCNRYGAHKKKYNKWKKGLSKLQYSSFDLFNKYGIENCKCILIELYSCSSKEELRSREEYWRKQLNTINKYKAIRTKEDLREYDRIQNKEKSEKRKKKIFICEICMKKTNKRIWNDHKSTKIHLKCININESIKKTDEEYNKLFN